MESGAIRFKETIMGSKDSLHITSVKQTLLAGTMNLSNFDLGELQEYTSKTYLSSLLGISQRTFYNYHEIALSLPSFEGDYPCFDCEPYTRVGLTRYQCWVIKTLMELGRRTPISKMVVRDSFGTSINPALLPYLSKEKFNSLTNKGTTSHELQRIC